MTGRFAEHSPQSLSMRVHLFGALVAPILIYCLEVWGPVFLCKEGTGRSSGSSVLHMLSDPQHVSIAS
jgi:hypothetical protein